MSDSGSVAVDEWQWMIVSRIGGCDEAADSGFVEWYVAALYTYHARDWGIRAIDIQIHNVCEVTCWCDNTTADVLHSTRSHVWVGRCDRA